MADTPEQENGDKKPKGAEKKKSPGGPGIVQRAGAVLLLVGAMGAAAYSGAVFAVGQERLIAFASGAMSSGEEEFDAFSQMHIALPETVYALSGGGDDNYLMARITLRTDQQHSATVNQLLPEIQTVFQMFIRELTVEELKGATGLYQLRKACLHRARKVAGERAVQDIFITDILVR